MESELLKEWIAEERKEVLQNAMLGQLEEKFDIVPKHIREKLQQVEDDEILNALSRKLISASSLEEFEKLLDKALK